MKTIIEKLKDIQCDTIGLTNEFMYLGSMKNMSKMLDLSEKLVDAIQELERCTQ